MSGPPLSEAELEQQVAALQVRGVEDEAGHAGPIRLQPGPVQGARAATSPRSHRAVALAVRARFVISARVGAGPRKGPPWGPPV